MFKESMSIKELDNMIIQKNKTTGHFIDELVKELSYSDLKLYDKKFKEENNIPGEITSNDMTLLTDVGNQVLVEKLKRDQQTVEKLFNW